MSPEQVKQLCECIRQSSQAGNLVPWREVHSSTVSLTTDPAAGHTRLTIKLEPTERTRAYVAVIQPRPAPTEGEAAAAMYRVMANDDAATVHAQLIAGQGRIVPAGGDYTHAIPAWARKWWIDLLGVQQSDATTRQACTVDVVVYEMVAALDVATEEARRC